MPFVTFTVRRGLGTADKSRLSEAMLEVQVAAGYHRADRFHLFLEVDEDDLLVDPLSLSETQFGWQVRSNRVMLAL
jgi:hypothetical protein